MELIKSMIQDPSVPHRMLFKAVSEMFPNNGTADEIYLTYIKQTSTGQSTEQPAEPVSPELFLKSYHKYFCRRCFSYGCVQHEPKEYAGPNGKKLEQPKSERCGDKCYMNQLTGGHTEQDPPCEAGAPFFEFDDVWTGSDLSIFKVLRTSFLDNYCAIARGMQNKSCQQVYEFVKMDNESCAQQELSDSGPPPTKRSLTTKPQPRKPPPTKPYRFLKNTQKDQTENIEHHYTPCDHEGLCGVGCPCFDRSNHCEKFCKCPSNCNKRFPGCSCKGQCMTNSCTCYIAFRECDPDICKCDMDPKKPCCENVRIQRGLHKHLLLAPSDVAGWGIFIKDGAKKRDFIYVSMLDGPLSQILNRLCIFTGILRRKDHHRRSETPRDDLHEKQMQLYVRFRYRLKNQLSTFTIS